MSIRRQVSTLALAALVALIAVPTAALAQASFYASCTECHTLSVDEAQGMMEAHGQAYAPEFPEAVCMNCHDPYPHETPSWPPYWWMTPLSPYSYPAGPSLTVQTCDTCHDRTQPPLNAHHPYDTIPYVSGAYPGLPPQSSILPLFAPDGLPNQDPGMGGMTCATCHDPHEPGSWNPTTGKYTFGRISNDMPGTSCTWCHDDKGSPPAAYDLYIDRGTGSVTFNQYPPDPITIVEVTVSNRGNAPYFGGNLHVWVEQGYSGPTYLGSFWIPSVPPDGTALVTFPWDSSEATESVVFHLLPDSGMPQPLNPDRPPVFIRTYALVPQPQGLTVVGAYPDAIQLAWDPPPPTYPGYVEYEVYRDGTLVTPYPVPGPSFVDWPLSPETPHTYAVRAVTPEGRTSAMSARLGAATAQGYAVLRVPEEYATIQEAIMAAGSGASIHVAPGVYTEPISFLGKSGISVVGQDAEGCVLDYGVFGTTHVDLGVDPASPNMLAGFTIVGGTVDIGPGDTVARCVFRDGSAPSVAGGGLVTNCVFDQVFSITGAPMEVHVAPGEAMTVANSVFLDPDPFWVYPGSDIYLLNNSFDGFFFDSLPGEGNFWDLPQFVYPGPPDTYVVQAGMCIDAGFDVGLPFMYAPDVGAFELGVPFSPKPPSGLTAAPDGVVGGIRLSWTLAPGDPASPLPEGEPILEYLVYRREAAGPGFTGQPIASVPSGISEYFDTSASYGITYAYEVRASAGAPWPLEPVALSRATNAATAAVNFAPVAGDDTYATEELTPLLVSAPGVLANDTDPDGDPLTAEIVTMPAFGDLVLLADGTVYYTPWPSFQGADSFTYVATDGANDSAPALVTIVVSAANHPPVLQPIGPRSVAEADRLLVDLSATDPDAGDLLAFSAAGLPPFCALTDFGDGTGVLDCSPGFLEAGLYAMTVTVTDNGAPELSDAETFDLTVTDANQPPVAGDDAYAVDENSTLAVAAPGVLGNDSDADGDSLAAVLEAGPASGSLALASNGSFTYTPDPYFSGTDSFTYRASDATGTSLPATVTVTVSDINFPPVAENDPYNNITDEDTALSVGAPGVLGNDSDPDGDPLTAVLVSGPANGAIVLNADGSYAYTPAPDFNGYDSVTYLASDGALDSAPAVLTLFVSPVNDAPVAHDQGVTTAEDTPVVVTLGATDVDSPFVTFQIEVNPSHGTLSGGAPDITYTPDPDYHGPDSFTFFARDGMLDSNVATVTITVTPVNDAPQVANPGNQAGSEGDTASLQIAAADPDGDSLSYAAAGLPDGLAIDPATGLVSGTFSSSSGGTHAVTVTVSDGTASTEVDFAWSVTDVPVIRASSIAMGEYSSKGKTVYTALVTVRDDLDRPVGGAAVTGHWSGVDTDPAPATVTTAADGTAAFETPGIRKPAGVYGFTVDAVGKAGSVYDEAGSVTSAQYPPPGGGSPPVAVDDTASTAPDTPVTIAVLANDSDPDGDPLAVTSLTQPANGTATDNGDGTVTYAPAAGFTGTDTFTYTAGDGTAESNPALVTVTVAEPPAGGEMHVAAIDMSVSGRKIVRADTVVTVVDSTGAPVSGVTASGNWSGAAAGAVSGVTGADGTVSLASPGVKDASGQTFTFTATGLAKDGWTYDAAANAETSDSITAP